MNHQYNFNKNDEYNTPVEAVLPICKYIKKTDRVWCPFDKVSSNYVKVLSNKDVCEYVYSSHIENGADFFDVPTPSGTTLIVSNPPFSKRANVFKRLYEIGLPFAMLLNIQGLFDSNDRFEMFSKNNVQLLYLYPRVSYITENKTSSVPFQSVYVCSNLLEKDIDFYRIQKQKTSIQLNIQY